MKNLSVSLLALFLTAPALALAAMDQPASLLHVDCGVSFKPIDRCGEGGNYSNCDFAKNRNPVEEVCVAYVHTGKTPVAYMFRQQDWKQSPLTKSSSVIVNAARDYRFERADSAKLFPVNFEPGYFEFGRDGNQAASECEGHGYVGHEALCRPSEFPISDMRGQSPQLLLRSEAELRENEERSVASPGDGLGGADSAL